MALDNAILGQMWRGVADIIERDGRRKRFMMEQEWLRWSSRGEGRAGEAAMATEEPGEAQGDAEQAAPSRRITFVIDPNLPKERVDAFLEALGEAVAEAGGEMRVREQ